MFIVKEGDPNRLSKEETFECPACGCIFVAKKTEYQTYIDASNDTYIECECPYCHLMVTKF